MKTEIRAALKELLLQVMIIAKEAENPMYGAPEIQKTVAETIEIITDIDYMLEQY